MDEENKDESHRGDIFHHMIPLDDLPLDEILESIDREQQSLAKIPGKVSAWMIEELEKSKQRFCDAASFQTPVEEEAKKALEERNMRDMALFGEAGTRCRDIILSSLLKNVPDEENDINT